MKILGAAHWLLPWLITILGLAAMLKFVRSHMDEKPFSAADRRLMAAFTGLMDLQGGIGLVYLFWSGLARDGFPAYRIFHAITMFVAMLIPHLSRRWLDEESSLNLHSFYILLATFLVMMVGISLIPS